MFDREDIFVHFINTLSTNTVQFIFLLYTQFVLLAYFIVGRIDHILHLRDLLAHHLYSRPAFLGALLNFDIALLACNERFRSKSERGEDQTSIDLLAKTGERLVDQLQSVLSDGYFFRLEDQMISQNESGDITILFRQMVDSTWL